MRGRLIEKKTLGGRLKDVCQWPCLGGWGTFQATGLQWESDRWLLESQNSRRPGVRASCDQDRGVEAREASGHRSLGAGKTSVTPWLCSKPEGELWRLLSRRTWLSISGGWLWGARPCDRGSLASFSTLPKRLRVVWSNCCLNQALEAKRK